MREEAARISAALHEIQREAAKGSMPWGELQSRTRRRLRQEEQPDAGFTRLEDHFQKIPVIQYDGPFSDHVLQRKPRGLTGDDVSEEEAGGSRWSLSLPSGATATALRPSAGSKAASLPTASSSAQRRQASKS